MKEKTSTLLSQLSKTSFVDDRLRMLKDSFSNETVYIVAAGPSLNDIPINQLKEFLSDKLVFCIKQSYYPLKDVCDFLFLNFKNLSRYVYRPHTIVNWCYEIDSHPQLIKKEKWRSDLVFPITRNSLEESLCHKKDWENCLFDHSIERPFGPSIIYEAAIPMAIHLGCSKIVTIGWDIGNPSSFSQSKEANQSNELKHFYSEDVDFIDKANLISLKELELTISGMSSLYSFLQKKNIEFNIVSSKNPVTKKIPRVSFETLASKNT